jgi:hypothetical protein
MRKYDTFEPDGNLVRDIIITSGDPDSASTIIVTNLAISPSTPSTPAPGTYNLIAIPDGEPVSNFPVSPCQTFQREKCLGIQVHPYVSYLMLPRFFWRR